jgi:ABC-type uncharacterized transport system involved in gliding motility auxiliary subunit
MKRHAGAISLLGGFILLAGLLTLALDFVLDRETTWIPLVTLGCGAVLAAISGALEPGLFRHYGRWINASLGGIMVFLIVAMVNFLGSRYHDRIDLTEGRLYSLADLTVETLQGLDREVRAVGFMEGGVDEDLEIILEGYASHSPKFSFEMIDPDKEPKRTADYGVRSYDVLLIEDESTGEIQNVMEPTEREITNALLKVTREGTQRIYLTLGHGESGVQVGAKSYGRFERRLEEISFVVEDSLFLARTGEVPENCAVLVVAGPRFAFLETEIQAIDRYLQRGGAALILLDPSYEVGLGTLLAKWGIVVGDDFVIDTSGVGSLFGLDFTTPVAVQYDDEHPIVRKHRGGLMTLFELARSVRFESNRAASAGLTGTALVLTSEQSWAEADVSVLSAGQGKRAISLDEEVDRVGPVALGVAVQGQGESGGRLVVFGDSDFAADSYFDVQGNGDLALNALSWLAADESLISIRPKEAGHTPIALTESDSSTISWLLALYPLAIFVAGIIIVGRARAISPRVFAQVFSRVLIGSIGRTSVVALVVLGVLTSWLLDRHAVRFDLTEDKLYTLSSDTAQLLSQVDAENRFVTVKTFMSKEEGLRFQDTMEEYDYLSSNFSYEIIDPQKNRLEVEQHGIRQRGTSIVEVLADGKVTTERFEEQSEEALSNAIQSALRADERRIASISGHDEGQLTLVDGKGYSILNGRLKELNFQIEEGVDLNRDELQRGQILLALAPKQPFSSSEVDALRVHLKRGGDALLLLDPGPPTGLEALLQEYAVDLGQNFIVDLSPVGQLFGADVSMPVVLRYGEHPITATLAGGTMSFYPFARSVAKGLYQPPGTEVNELVITDQSSWGESDLSPILGQGGKVEFDETADLSGPLSLAVAVRADADTVLGGVGGDKARLVVFGDSDFATNDYFGQHANGALVINSLKWLVEGEDKLDIPVKTPRSNPINLIAHEGDTILWLSVFVLPLAVALCGMVVVLRRGAAGYLEGFVTWQMFCFYAAGALYLGIHLVESGTAEAAVTLGYLVASIGNFAIARSVREATGRNRITWASALVICLANVGLAFSVLPLLWQQVVYAAIFAANTAMLAWMHRDFLAGEASDAGLEASS